MTMKRWMRLGRAVPAAALLALAAATCQRSTGTATAPPPPSSPPPPPAPATQPPPPLAPATQQEGVAGAWQHREMPVRYLETMTLATSGENVTGTGTYMMEGGRGGSTSITGTFRGGTVRLAITRDSGVREQYVGTLQNGRLTGTLTVDGNPQPFAFDRPAPEP